MPRKQDFSANKRRVIKIMPSVTLMDLTIIIILLSCALSYSLNSLITIDDFCRLLITFANSLDSDQDRQKIGYDLDPNRSSL